MGLLDILRKRGITPKKKTEKEWASPCPFCGGEDRFCIWPEKNRAQCIRGCGWKGDDIQLLMDSQGMSFKQAKEAVGRKDLPPERMQRGRTKDSKNTIDAYLYKDKKGEPLYQVCRTQKAIGEKIFFQRRPDGKGGWIKGTKGIRMVLFNLPEVLKSSQIWICEGERDCLTMAKLGIGPATCNPMGAGKWPKLEKEHDIGKPLHGKSVYILPDNDGPGKKHAEDIARSLYGKAKDVRILQMPGLPEKGDVSDYLSQYGEEDTIETLIKLANETSPWTPPKPFFTLQDLYDLPDDDHIPIIDGGIMPWNSHILIAGESGVGKSLLRLELAIHLAMGWSWMDFRVPRARSVAIFQYENSERSEKYRIRKMLEGLGIKVGAIGDRVKYARRDERYNLALKGDRVKLLQKVKELRCEVLVFDCLSNIHDVNENDNVKMRAILDVLVDINAQLKTSSILIHHFGKPADHALANYYRIRGASSIIDWAYTVLTFTRKPHEEKTLRKIEFVKVRDGRQPKPFLVERDPETFLCSSYDEEALVPPNLIVDVLKDQFNGTVDKQSELVDLIMQRTGCGNRTARAGIKNALRMKSIYEFQGQNKRFKGYRLPMSEQWQ